MTELINSLKTFAYSGSIAADRRSSTGQLRIIPLLNLGVGKPEIDTGFNQWRDAMRMVSRLPGGLPTEFRLKLWENLSEKYLQEKGISWSKVLSKSATPTSRDSEIADQIHKDLHRTGCTGFSSGAKQAKLKSVLVAYGRWNPGVGYCQGFNMIGAMLLEMMGGDETLTLKVLIFLIEGVLPQGYFSGGLRGLAVDMAVFREILRLKKPTLHAQLCRLQGGEEQPPLIDVFVMHWFLTLFIHCLPTPSVLRIWDLVFLEGSEVLLRTALVLWAAIETRILDVRSSDEFYSIMGVVTREMLEVGLMDPNSLVKCIVSVGPFPFPGLVDLRLKHRALLQQDTPYKSFFLAKRELDNLKKHYANIRHRQKATTIILKGLEASKMRVPGTRSNSLFIPASAKNKSSFLSGNANKPKLRRGSSGSTKLAPANSNSNSINNNQQSQNQRNVNNANVAVGGRTRQVTVAWDRDKGQQGQRVKSSAGKSFRRRRTLSSSSMRSTTSSSSSTELCDTDEDCSEDPEMWNDNDKGGKPKLSESLKKDHHSSDSSSEGVWSDSDNKWVKKRKKLQIRNANNSSKENDDPETEKNAKSEKVIQVQDNPPQNNSCLGDELDDLDKELSSIQRSPSILDTNDSQHFLEEMNKLGKSDSFYENLSKRICELQFQNLKTLSSCQTFIDPKSLALPPFPKSPLASPLSPSFLPGGSLTPSPSPKNLTTSNNSNSTSPRGSVSGESLSAGPATFREVSPCPSPKLSRRSSTSRGQSSGEQAAAAVPDIWVTDSRKNSSDFSSIKALSVSPSELGFKPLILSPLTLSIDKEEESKLNFPETATFKDKEDLLSPRVTTPSSPQKLQSAENSENSPLVSPKTPETRRKADLLLTFSKSSEEKDNTSGEKNDKTFSDESPLFFKFSESEDSFKLPFRTTLCPTQLSSEVEGDELESGCGSVSSGNNEIPSEEEIKINAVIRENIAILQRLKLNKAPSPSGDEGEESYETDKEDEAFEDFAGNSNSNPNSLSSFPVKKKERLSSVSSQGSCSACSGRSSSIRGRSRRKRRSLFNGNVSVSSGSGSSSYNANTTDSVGPSPSGKSRASKGSFSFNPFPTVRRARLRVTKYGLYN